MSAELKPGYKQTEVGMIPEDWEAKTIDEVGFVTSGKRLPLGSSLTEHETLHPYIRITDMRPGTVALSDIKFVPESVFPAIKRYRIFRDDIFISVAGTLGIVGKVPIELNGANLTENANRITNITCSQDYLLHVLMSPLIQNTIDSIQTVGAQPKLALTRIRKFAVPLPPTKAEQEAIAEALSDADALIESLEQLITKKRHIKQGAMQELLTGQKRLPGFSGEWELKPLDAVAQIRSGGTPSTNRPEFWDGDVLWCTPTDITALNGFKYLTHTARQISLQGLTSSSAELIPAHSVVMTSRATIGECAINAVPVATNQGFKNFIPYQATDCEFLYYLLQTKKHDFMNLCGGSTFLEIGKAQLVGFEIELPSEYEEQAAIAAILSDMDAEIAALEAKLAKARQIKQGMMQELLTGRIRLV